MVLLVGSSIGMMQKIMDSKAGALYGRAQKIKISPFKYIDFRLMFEELSEEQKILKTVNKYKPHLKFKGQTECFK